MKRLTACVLLLSCLAAPAGAAEFRRFTAIPAPRDRSGTVATEFLPVDERVVTRALEELARAWNTPELRRLLDPDFYDRSRVLDAIDTMVPRDARLRLLAIESMKVVEQTVRPVPGQDALLVRSLVSTFVRTQVEFNDPLLGFQRHEGVNEFILEVQQVVAR